MIDGEIEVKDKIFICKKGTKLGKSDVNYYIQNCLFILNSSRKWEKKNTIKTNDSFIISTKGGALFEFDNGFFTFGPGNEFTNVVWIDFKKRWKLIKEAQDKGKTLSFLFDEVTEEKELEAAEVNRLVRKGW